MRILSKIRRALEKRALKKKIIRLGIEASKQGKTVESLSIILDTRFCSPSNRIEFVLSDGTTNKRQIPNKSGAKRVVPVKESPIDAPYPKESDLQQITMLGRCHNYDAKLVWVEDYDEAGVKVFLVIRRDEMKDILQVKGSGADKGSVTGLAIWWIENKEKVCEKFIVTATSPAKRP